MSGTELRSIQPAVKALERIYERALPLFPEDVREEMAANRPVILVHSKGRKNALGWHWRDRWQNGSGKITEIVVTAEYLDRPVEEIIETMVHEMVHHANAIRGVKDVSGNQYHNRKFADLAEEVGLVVSKMKGKGFASTDLGDDLRKTVTKWKVDEAAFSIKRLAEGGGKGRKKGSKLKKWACDCGYGIRIAVSPEQVDLTCGICGGRVLPAE